MARGTKIHSTIKDRSEEAARKTSELGSQVRVIENRILELNKQRNSIYEECAQRIMDEVRSGNVATPFHQIVAKEFKDNEMLLKSLNDSFSATSAKMDEVGVELGKVKNDYIVTQDALGKLKMEIDAQLKSSKEWVELTQKISDLTSGADNLKQKIKLAREDRKKKETAYLTDPYFSYLFQRGYGTENYNPFFITRLLDDWVASICNYKVALDNFNLLHKLEEYLVRSGAEGSNAIRELEDQKRNLERNAQTDDVKRYETQLSTIARRVQSVESDYAVRAKDVDSTKRKIETCKATLSKGSTKSREKLISALQEASMPTLAQVAGNGVTISLNSILQAIRDQERKLLEQRTAYANAKGQSDRLAELERRVARDYKNKDFRSSFDPDDFVTGYLLGTMTMSDMSRNVSSSSSSYDSSDSYSRSSSYGSSSSYSSDSYSSSRSSSSDSGFSSGGSFGGSDSSGGFSSGGDF